MNHTILKMVGINVDKKPMFKNNCGRTLSRHAIMYLSKGEGYFEDSNTKRTEVTPGSIFYLHPGVWHNFDPKPGTVWTECWALFDGAKAVDLFGELIPKAPTVYNLAPSLPLQEAYERLCELNTCKSRLSVEEELYLLHFILMDCLLRINKSESREGEVAKAKQAIRQAVERKAGFDFKLFAEKEGLGYEKFRKQFAKETGLSPLNYLMELRMGKAMEMLIQPGPSVKEIAEALGFEDPYYFSRLFKRRKGVSPEAYRKALLKR